MTKLRNVRRRQWEKWVRQLNDLRARSNGGITTTPGWVRQVNRWNKLREP